MAGGATTARAISGTLTDKHAVASLVMVHWGTCPVPPQLFVTCKSPFAGVGTCNLYSI